MSINRTVNWHNIRTHNGSQYGGFEELCTQLARSEKPRIPKATKFRRLGNPDGGIECYWEDSDGNKYGWQAKYYPANQDPDRYYLKDIRWDKVTDSINTALEKHRELVCYYVCIPKNLTLNMDTDWDPRVAQWKDLARIKTGKEVEFELWDTSALLDRLIQPEHAGRLLYWFNERIFNDDWFKDNVTLSIEDDDTTKPNIETEIADKLEIFGRTPLFINQLMGYTEVIQKAIAYLRRPYDRNSKKEQPSFEIRINELRNPLKTIQKQLADLTPEPNNGPSFQNISRSVCKAKTVIEKFKSLLSNYAYNYDTENENEKRRIKNLYEARIRQIDQICQELDELKIRLDYASDVENKRLMIISGNAGIGKTHLLCDIAEKRVDEGLPTVLLLGQHFTGPTEPWKQVLNLLGLSDMKEGQELVTALESAAQRARRRVLFIIDAVNDVSSRVEWNSHLNRFLKTLKKSFWINVVLSVRTTYEHQFIPSSVRSRAVYETHKGFEGMEHEAIQAFFPNYVPSNPFEQVMYPEFRNPLFLKFISEIFKGNSEEALSQVNGISDAFERYQEHINENLENLGYLREDRDVHKALMRIAQRIVESKKQWLEREVAKELVNQPFPERRSEQSLYYGMTSESVLIESIIQRNGRDQEVVRITYQLFADHIIASYLLQKYPNKDKFGEAFAPNGELAFLLDDRDDQIPPEGIIEALNVQTPEQLKGSELIELVPTLLNRKGIGKVFWHSLLWRKRDAFSGSTEKILKKLVEIRDERDDVIDALLEVTVLQDHPYNAKFLDKLLRQYSMAERDAWWSIYLHNTYNSQGPVDRLLGWALQRSPDSKLEKEIVELASIALAWTLTSSNRHLRDRATKALVALLTEHLVILHRILKLFADVNDPYVEERLYAVAYGVTMRSHDKKNMGDVAQWVYDNVFAGSPPAHILLRDYARGVIERAFYLGSEINIDRDLIEPPYNSEFPRIPTEEEMKELTVGWKLASYDKGEIEWSRNRIKESIMNDDFARYVVSTNSSFWVPLEAKMEKSNNPPYFKLEDIRNYILKRVFDLGWTLKLFGEFDTHEIRYLGWTATKAERIGKKYQWIAFHEIMAYISDHFQYIDGNYEGPWQACLRDIDPSVTLLSNKGGDDGGPHKQSWWAGNPHTGWRENDTHITWLERKDDIPRIENLLRNILKVTTKNKNWLNLSGDFLWRTPETIEDENSDLGARKLWLNFTSCFVRNSDVESFMNWAEGLGSAKNEMKRPRKIRGVFFGEYGWSPAFRSMYGRDGDKHGFLDECPVNAHIAVFECSYNHSKFDCSVDHHNITTLLVPCFDLLKMRELKWEGRNAEFIDAKGKLAACDPTATEEGPTSLLVREDLVRNYLKKNDLTLCWLVGGEKELVYYADWVTPVEEVGGLKIYGEYILGERDPQGGLRIDDSS